MRSANFMAVELGVSNMIDNVCNDYVRIELIETIVNYSRPFLNSWFCSFQFQLNVQPNYILLCDAQNVLEPRTISVVSVMRGPR